MVESDSGHRFLLVVADPLTRYLKSFPLVDRTAIGIAEIILQRICFKEGNPDVIVYDHDKSFVNAIHGYIYKTLNIKQIFLSPYNHGSLVPECFIGSLANLIVANLSGNRRQWPLYSNAATYTYNTFSIPSLQGLSQYELFMKENHLP